jgi:hypothetical protein
MHIITIHPEFVEGDVDLDAQAGEAAVGTWRAKLLVLLIAAALFGAITAPATPAAAATTQYGWATACFYHTTTTYPGSLTGPYTYTSPWKLPVNVEYWWGDRAVYSTTISPGSNGCVGVWLPVGYYWRFTVNTTAFGSTWSGVSAWKLVAGYYTYDFGWVSIRGG